MAVTVDGILMLVKLLHSLKADSGIDGIPSGKDIDRNKEQSSKAWLSIAVIPAGSFMDRIFLGAK